MLVPKVDSDGNELGGVPTVLRDAPLGTYLGWNITRREAHGVPRRADLQLRRRHGAVLQDAGRSDSPQAILGRRWKSATVRTTAMSQR